MRLLPRFRKTPIITYSSQDYIEQLRTVHFALLSISAALLVLILGAKTYDSQKAKIQLEELMAFQKLWTPEFLLKKFEVMTCSKAETPPVPLNGLYDIPVSVTEPGTRPKLFYLPRVSKDQFFWKDASDDILTSFPTKLGDLETWWNKLSHGQHVLVRPTAITTECEYSPASDAICKVFHLLMVPPGILQHTHITIDERSLQLQECQLIVESSGDRLHVQFFFDVATYWQHSVQQSDVLPQFPESKGGEFAVAFHDLHLATAGMSSLELRDVLKNLSDNTDSEIFEAFGLKIPAAEVTTLGPIIIVCIQLYFYVYLRSLKNPLEQSDEAWKVGWFAVSDMLLPGLIFFVTVFLLPPLTVIFLSMHAVGQRAVPYLILGCLLSVILGYLNWRSRPRIRRWTVTPSQIFE